MKQLNFVNLFLKLILFLFIISCSKKEIQPQQTQQNSKDSVEFNYPSFNNLDTISTFQGKQLSSEYIAQKHEELAHFFEWFWKLNQVSGGLLVAKNGQILYENYIGYANRETKDTITATTPIHLASVSKVLTGLVVLKMVDEGKVKLNQPFADFFPKFPYKTITIKNLMTHRSGLPNYAYFPQNDSIWDQHTIKSNQDVLNALNHQLVPPYNPPDKAFSYSNTNYVLLALLVEKVTEMPYPEAIQKMLFEPIGMKHTFVFQMKDTVRVSQSYTYRNRKWDFNFLDAIYGDKNIYSTPRDLFKLDKAMYAKNFLSDSLLVQMKKGYSNERKGIKNYGLGIRMMIWNDKQKLLYHNGWWHGNYTSYVRGEKDSITIIALGNRRTRSVYSAFSLAGILGDYPVAPDEEEMGENAEKIDSLQMDLDSISLPKKEPKKIKKPKKDSIPLWKKMMEKEKKTAPKKDSIPLKIEN